MRIEQEKIVYTSAMRVNLKDLWVNNEIYFRRRRCFLVCIKKRFWVDVLHLVHFINEMKKGKK